MKIINQVNRKAYNKVRKEIISRIDYGGVVSTPKLTQEFFNPKNLADVMLAQRRIQSLISSIVRNFTDQGRTCGRLNPEGEYGFPRNESEARYLNDRRRAITEGHIFSTIATIVNSQNEGLVGKDQIEEREIKLLGLKKESKAKK